jgi:hypothetical protein
MEESAVFEKRINLVITVFAVALLFFNSSWADEELSFTGTINYVESGSVNIVSSDVPVTETKDGLVCVTGIPAVDAAPTAAERAGQGVKIFAVSPGADQWYYLPRKESRLDYKKPFRCEDLQNFKQKMHMIGTSIYFSGVVATASGVGAEVGVPIMIAGAGIRFLEIVVAGIPCDNSTSEDAQKQLIEEAVRIYLESVGVDLNEGRPPRSEGGYLL